jgi:soluble P-type ATPase
MLKVEIPGFGDLALDHLVLDYNGTLAAGGTLLAGVAQRLARLAGVLEIHVVTADTYGTAGSAPAQSGVRVTVLPAGAEDVAKAEFVRGLGSAATVAVGNGRNDALMLQEAVLGVAVIQEEGAAGRAVAAADIVCPDILAALDLLVHPLRLKATLRT